MYSKNLKFSDEQKEVLRTLASLLCHEFSGKWVTAGQITQLKPNAIKSLVVAGYIKCHQYNNLTAYQLTSKGWQARHALMHDAVQVDACVGDAWKTQEGTFVLAGFLPMGIPVADYIPENVCPHCGHPQPTLLVVDKPTFTAAESFTMRFEVENE